MNAGPGSTITKNTNGKNGKDYAEGNDFLMGIRIELIVYYTLALITRLFK